MKKLLVLGLMLSTLFGGYLSDNFLKFSTFYGSVSMSSPFVQNQQFKLVGGEVQEQSRELEYDYNISFGVRKIARFGYETKAKKFYDGSEKAGNESVTIGSIPGWEYLFKYSKARSFGEIYNNHEYWLRYVGSWFTIRGQYSEFGLEALTYSQIDLRHRKELGNFDITSGLAFRGHPIVIDPQIDWQEQFGESWWELAYEMGYHDEFYWIDEYEGIGDWYWYDVNGDLISETDAYFYDIYFDDIIDDYHEMHILDLGWQWEASVAIGVDYYKYTDKWWIHAWGSVLPFHYGVTKDANVEGRGIDHDVGMILGWKLTPHFGVFTEGRHLSYFTTEVVASTHYELKAGINYIIF